MIVIPRRAKFGFLLCERYGGRGSATVIRTIIERAFRRRFGESGVVIRFEALLNATAWAAFVGNADLKSIKVNRYSRSSDVADGIDISQIGKVTCSVKPRRGLGRFPAAIKDAILDRSLSAQDLIGIPAGVDDDVSLQLDDGDQQKQLILGHEEPPNLIYMINRDGDDRPDSAAVFKEMTTRLESELAIQAGVQLAENWRDGSWTEEDLAVKMPAMRDGA
jgi:hypothetical protein